MYTLASTNHCEFIFKSYSVEHNTRRNSSYSGSLWIYGRNKLPLGVFGHSETPS